MPATQRGPIGPRASLASNAAILLAASVIAGVSPRPWTWHLFVWGVALGVAAVAWAYFSTRAFGASIVRSSPDQRDAIRTQARGLWARQRWTYLGVLVLGCSAGIIAAGMDRAWVDIVFAVLWIVAGVLPPLVAYPILKRRFVNRTRSAKRS